MIAKRALFGVENDSFICYNEKQEDGTVDFRFWE